MKITTLEVLESVVQETKDLINCHVPGCLEAKLKAKYENSDEAIVKVTHRWYTTYITVYYKKKGNIRIRMKGQRILGIEINQSCEEDA